MRRTLKDDSLFAWHPNVTGHLCPAVWECPCLADLTPCHGWCGQMVPSLTEEDQVFILSGTDWEQCTPCQTLFGWGSHKNTCPQRPYDPSGYRNKPWKYRLMNTTINSHRHNMPFFSDASPSLRLPEYCILLITMYVVELEPSDLYATHSGFSWLHILGATQYSCIFSTSC